MNLYVFIFNKDPIYKDLIEDEIYGEDVIYYPTMCYKNLASTILNHVKLKAHKNFTKLFIYCTSNMLNSEKCAIFPEIIEENTSDTQSNRYMVGFHYFIGKLISLIQENYKKFKYIHCHLIAAQFPLDNVLIPPCLNENPMRYEKYLLNQIFNKNKNIEYINMNTHYLKYNKNIDTIIRKLSQAFMIQKESWGDYVNKFKDFKCIKNILLYSNNYELDKNQLKLVSSLPEINTLQPQYLNTSTTTESPFNKINPSPISPIIDLPNDIISETGQSFKNYQLPLTETNTLQSQHHLQRENKSIEGKTISESYNHLSNNTHPLHKSNDSFHYNDESSSMWDFKWPTSGVNHNIQKIWQSREINENQPYYQNPGIEEQDFNQQSSTSNNNKDVETTLSVPQNMILDDESENELIQNLAFDEKDDDDDDL